MSAHHLERRPGGESSTADIIITLNTNTAPSSEVEPRTLRQALCLLLKTNESLDNLKFETEVGPSNFRKPDQFGSLNDLNPNCSASILPMSSWISKLSSAAQSSTQISIIIHGNHPWSYEKVSETPSVFLTFIFKISDLRSIKERPLSWRSSYRLNTAHLRRQIQVGEGDTNSKFHHYWYTTIFMFPRSKYDTPPTHNGNWSVAAQQKWRQRNKYKTK